VVNFYARTVNGEFVCSPIRLWFAWLMIVLVFACLILATPTRSRVWQARHRRSSYSDSNYVYLKLTTITTANTTVNFLWLNDHINLIDFIYGD
jgi:hypothetical protein